MPIENDGRGKLLSMGVIDVNQGRRFPDAVTGAFTDFPLIPNTMGKCDTCENYDSDRTVCLAGQISPVICGSAYRPMGSEKTTDNAEGYFPGEVGKSFSLRDFDLVKSHVKAHTRKTKSGKISQVKEYEDKRTKKAGATKEVGVLQTAAYHYVYDSEDKKVLMIPKKNPERHNWMVIHTGVQNEKDAKAIAQKHDRGFKKQPSEKEISRRMATFKGERPEDVTNLFLKAVKESEFGGRMGGPYKAGPGGECQCPKCGATVKHDTGGPCTDLKCPKCGAMMDRKDVKKSVDADFFKAIQDSSLEKSRVKAHTRRTQGGKISQVKEYDDKRTKKAGDQGGSKQWNKQTLINQIHTKIHPHTTHLWNDESWQGIHAVWDVMNDMGLDWDIMDSSYDKRGFPPTYKVWKIRIKFEDKKGKQKTIYGSMTAHGGGSVKDPLDKYDITFTMG